LIKRLLQRTARKYGYEVRKAPQANFGCVSVFDLAMQYLIAIRGEQQIFLEVGANDGVSGDPLREYILKYKWQGVMVEPQPDVFARLKANYAGEHEGIAFENVAISSDPNPLKMYRLPISSRDSTLGTSTVASGDPKVAAKQLHMKTADLEKIHVPTARLNDLMQKHGLEELGILQLDTEGFDWDALQTLDLTRTRPWLIRFEHGHLSPHAIGAMTKHLNAHDYDVNFGGYEADSIALRKDFIRS
jgi:FkbM family methyltransferase